MEYNVVLISIVFLVMACVTAVFLKRKWHVSYDRKSLLAPLMAVLVISVLYFSGLLAEGIFDSTTWETKTAWLLVVIFGINGILQFMFWLLWSILSRFHFMRLPRFVFNMMIFAIFVGAILYSIKHIYGVELKGLLVTSTVVSAIIGLALQDTLGNLFSGISLQLESPFSVDDWVNLGGFEGRIVSQNWRTLTLLTRDHHRVMLTNKFVAEDKIVNYSKPTRRQIHNFFIVLDYQHPPNFVKEVLLDMLEEIEEVVPHTTLGAYVVDYMDSGIKYGMKYWMTDYAYVNEIQDIVLTRLWYCLRRNNIKIPYPISEVQMKLLSTTESLEERKSQLSDMQAFLRKLDWLIELPDQHIEALSDHIVVKTYGKNDVIINQGDDGDSMFIIRDGKAKVYVSTDEKRLVEVAEKLPGEFVGEMSLLTGEPRSASVHAVVDMEVLVINKYAFTDCIMKNEQILKEMIAGMNRYKCGLALIIEEERQRADTTTESAREIVFQKIKAYLDL